jgi:AcrR family transcriptional regulator
MNGKKSNQNSAQQRLVDAAMRCFLNDDYHKVTTRQIAEAANTNVSMIRYYFGNKEGLYEEMIRNTLQPLIDVLDSDLLSTAEGFTEYFSIYYRTMSENPQFPTLILKILALNQGPGKRFVNQLLERGRQRGREKIERLKQHGLIDKEVDADIVRIAFVSLAMMPMLIKPVFEEELERKMDDALLEKLAGFNGRLFNLGLTIGQKEN